MAINLDRFSIPKYVVVPIIKNKGIYNKRFFTSSFQDGLYLVELGDQVSVLNEADIIAKEEFLNKLPLFRGIAYGDSLIPLNFDQAKFAGYKELNQVYFMNAEMGMVIKSRRWEDGTLLFHELDSSYQDQLLIITIKEKAEKKEALDTVKGITPEMRYFYLLLRLDLQRIEEWKELEKIALDKAEKERRIKEFQETFGGRLQKAITDAGGTLVRFNKRGSRVDVVWKVGGEEFHSTIEQDFRMLELGFCADGHDKDHSIASAILLAKDFIDRGLIYKTRE